MAKKSNAGLFEKAGYALGASKLTMEHYDHVKGLAALDNLKLQAKDIEEQNPNGRVIKKVQPWQEKQVAKKLVNGTQNINDIDREIELTDDPIIKQELQLQRNNMEQAFADFSAEQERFATFTQNVQNRYAGGKETDEGGNVIQVYPNNGVSESMTESQQQNYLNWNNGNYGPDGLDAQLGVDGKYYFKDFETGEHVLYNQLNIGTPYDKNLVEEPIEDLLSATRLAAKNSLAGGDKTSYESWAATTREDNRRIIEGIAKDPKAIKDYIYNNEELLDNYISNESGIPININGGINPEWTAFKNGATSTNIPVPYTGWKEEFKNPSYNFADGSDYNLGFTETALGMLDKEFNNTVTNIKKEGETQTKVNVG